MLEMAIAFIVGVACGRALDWYKEPEPNRENRAETEADGEEISVTEAKSE
jgi:hypothetical protein